MHKHSEKQKILDHIVRIKSTLILLPFLLTYNMSSPSIASSFHSFTTVNSSRTIWKPRDWLVDQSFCLLLARYLDFHHIWWRSLVIYGIWYNGNCNLSRSDYLNFPPSLMDKDPLRKAGKVCGQKRIFIWHLGTKRIKKR